MTARTTANRFMGNEDCALHGLSGELHIGLHSEHQGELALVRAGNPNVHDVRDDILNLARKFF